MHNMTSEFAARLRHASRTKDPSLPHSIARETAAPLLRRTPVAWPRWVEAGLVVAAIGAILPWFDRVAVDDLGRDRRFADAVIAVRGLPDPVLPSLCLTYGDLAEPVVRERLCRVIDGRSPVGGVDRMPSRLAQARASIRNAFIAPLDEAQARLSSLRLQQREGLSDLLALGNAIDASERELTPFVKHYQLDRTDGVGPLPFACAFEIVDGALAASTVRAANAQREVARANAVLLLGGALGGAPATAA